MMNGTLGNTYELIRRSWTATKLLIPQHHRSTCASQCSIPFNPLTVPAITGAEVIEFHLRSSSAWQAKTSITCYWGNDWLLDRKDTDTKSPAGIYCAQELVVDPSFWKWLGLHPRWCKRIARVTSIFFYAERPGRALIFDGNPPIPITLYSWWLSYVQSPHYLVGFIGVRLSDSESWTSKCPHEGTLCRPASLKATQVATCRVAELKDKHIDRIRHIQKEEEHFTIVTLTRVTLHNSNTSE